MQFLVLGEGNSDVGYSAEREGPLMDAVRWVVKPIEDLSHAKASYVFPRKAEVRAVAPKGGRRMGMRRCDEDKETAVFRRQAQNLATLAQREPNCGAIFFHDCDFTQKDVPLKKRKAYYQAVVRAMERGFAEAGFRDGVPMVPNPRSESWFLCLCRRADAPSHNYFENLPGNDRASQSGKELLAQALRCGIKEIYATLGRQSFDWAGLQAPSFLFFAKRLRHVAERLAAIPCTVQEDETLMIKLAGD